MYACKVVITTLDVILMLLLINQCIGKKDKYANIGVGGIIILLVMNLFCIWG